MERKNTEITGNIHSIESFGTVDGPGVRFVVFFQGCPMRCKFCHNPDTWGVEAANRLTVLEILQKYERNRAFYRNGGVTATGGEPLMQLDFLTELFTQFRKKGVHTCLDTSGYIEKDAAGEEKIRKLLSVTDLVMLDIKSPVEEVHRELTGRSLKPVLDFAGRVAEQEVPLRIRHVLVPGVTDGEESLRGLGGLLRTFPTLRELEVLPYHTMGEKKYEKLGISYPLAGVPALGKEDAEAARKKILDALY